MESTTRNNNLTTPTSKDAPLAHNIEQAAAGGHQAINKVADAVHPAVDRAVSGAHQAVDKIADVASQTAGTLSAKADQLQEFQSQLMQDCSAYVRAKPLTSLGIAIATGFVLSRLLSAR